MFVEREIQDIFLASRGKSKYSKDYINKHQGQYPVFTGATLNGGIGGYVNEYNETVPSLTFANTGEKAGATMVIKDEKYTVGPNRTKLTAKTELIDLEYISYVIQPVLLAKRKKTSTYTIVWDDVKTAKIPIPVTESGEFDLAEQKRLAKKCQYIENVKNQIQDMVQHILDFSLDIEIRNSKMVPMDKLFTKIKRGDSKYTKTYCKNNHGEYPMYSADNAAPLGYMKTFDFDGRYLTIAINGIAGKITVMNGKFSTNADRVTCVLKENSDIDIDYIRWIAEPLLRDATKGRKGDLNKNEFTKLTPTTIGEIEIPIPILPDGSYDLSKQIEIANKFECVEQLKNQIKDELDNIMNITVTIE